VYVSVCCVCVCVLCMCLCVVYVSVCCACVCVLCMCLCVDNKYLTVCVGICMITNTLVCAWLSTDSHSHREVFGGKIRGACFSRIPTFFVHPEILMDAWHDGLLSADVKQSPPQLLPSCVCVCVCGYQVTARRRLTPNLATDCHASAYVQEGWGGVTEKN